MPTLPTHRRSLRTRVLAAAVAAAAVVSSLLAGAGSAGAVTREYPLHGCLNVSPNIVDMPYRPFRAIVSEYAGTTYIQIDYGSLWIGVGYDSVARLDWHNLQTGRKGTMIDHSQVRPPNTGVHNFSLPRSTFGPGRVQLRLSTVNRNALWAIPARSCGGVVVAP
ncbi:MULTISPECIES: hypothetical protein [Gordonia]|uniref:Uncharacterized protein n=1 Tax=Gordonia sihwensis NBRC 108236 TaxID=1223544 RepID=L7LGA6_9ACTN|nr:MULTISPECIES: hypothetical protein [Gordonia]AUH67124.1 hypothetical protein CXX93_00495 [Gordonia sp. YC-JH1]KXT58507.1 hypothetical protein Y710_03015 [Gordonia sp. QH-12]MBY4569119.1 hypothetical protein [Gordonia sihwensis]WFN93232.1 hypothetical protein P5P27_01235 [Gordonia sihwensis]GAC59083.1 hypothetical protein GSI01S_01_00460 [Gordonia sihwensis NBRC 108236]